MLAAISVFWCMFTSAFYHTYQALGRKQYNCLLRADYIGISIMTLGQSFCIAYTGFHANIETRNVMIALITALFVSNLVVQLNPCYMKKSFDFKRTLMFLWFILFGIALILYLSFTANENSELARAYTLMNMGVGYLLVGLVFFVGHMPERFLTILFGKRKSSRWIREMVQLLIPSHALWHLAVYGNGYNIYWGIYYVNKHIEALSHSSGLI